jgi:hypothetical protein
MANVGKHQSIKQIKQTVERQALRTDWNDAAMVAFSGFLYCSLIEISLINVEDLITEKGKIKKEFVMPERITGVSKGRLVNVGKKGFIVEVIKHVVQYRISNGFGIIKNTGMYLGLEPETRFFLNRNGEPFKLKKNTSDNYQPYSIRRHMKGLNLSEGIDNRSLRESFVGNIWNASREIGIGDVDILKSLQKLTGLGTSTLRVKVIRRDLDVINVVKHLYENL